MYDVIAILLPAGTAVSVLAATPHDTVDHWEAFGLMVAGLTLTGFALVLTAFGG